MNIANKLTVLRILLIPVFLFVLLSNMPNNSIIALAIFIVASFTDFLDGYLARSMNLVTKLGKFLDPLADKLLVISAMLAFIEIGLLSSTVVFIIVSRELIISVFRAIAASEGIVIAASWWGKLKTNSQILMIVILLLNNYIPISISKYLNPSIILIATLFTVFSGVDYIIKNKQVLKS
ncbi:CDP-diacylglycerol--glycerol-3-phosphate 3-phosphatidyltransferase [Clostridiaceae bacterium HSG29]|nr:CDP-diacylglycerol--glycerol-3-phosphate 3-phosphatidyltransferase [Clostridiaceae bacterium HSG29]